MTALVYRAHASLGLASPSARLRWFFQEVFKYAEHVFGFVEFVCQINTLS